MTERCGGALAVALAIAAGTLPAQSPRRLDVQLGQWARADGGRASSYALRSSRRLAGPVQHGVGVHVLVDDAAGRRRAFYGAGYELTAWRAHRGLALYPLAALTLGLSTDSTGDAVAALWRAGLGLEWRPFAPVALGVEGAYVVEDRGPRGFWRSEDARTGWRLAAGVTIHWRGGGGRTGDGRRGAPRELRRPNRVDGRAAPVVETALEALGTPYAWGGSADNGFDCSGLIQYAYGRHGVSLPRRSRDQAQVGEAVPALVDALRAGDILAFSAEPGGGVAHVGLYVGDGLFIHSARDGVRVSALSHEDPEGGHWLARWVSARRLLP